MYRNNNASGYDVSSSSSSSPRVISLSLYKPRVSFFFRTSISSGQFRREFSFHARVFPVRKKRNEKHGIDFINARAHIRVREMQQRNELAKREIFFTRRKGLGLRGRGGGGIVRVSI